MSLIDASRLNTSPLVYQVKDFLIEHGAGFFWGPSGSGKTFTILDLALAIANGVPFMGRDTLPGTVAYMAGEGSGGLGIRIKARVLRQHDDDTKRIAAIARTEGDEAARAFAASLPPYTDDNLKVTTVPFPMHFDGKNQPNTDLAQVVAELRTLNTPPPGSDEETLENWPYLRLVILDALENFSGTLSVSHRSSANKIVNTMQWMATELQCCVLVVAHPVNGPAGLKMVGSDRLFAAADFVIRYAPDDVAAPGALPTATISCEKSKDDRKFDSFGVELHECGWDEPRLDKDWEPVPLLDEETGEQATDENGNPAWVTDKVTSQTVRLIEQGAAAAPPPARPVMPPPVLRDNPPKSRIRPILRPLPRERNGLHLVTDQDSAPLLAPVIVPRPGPASAEQELIRALLGARCPDCSRVGLGCDSRMERGTIEPLSKVDGVQTWIHDSRIIAAAEAAGDKPAQEAFLNEAIAVITAAIKRTQTPAPKPAPKRLSWTSVTPDSAAPTLAELGLAGH